MDNAKQISLSDRPNGYWGLSQVASICSQQTLVMRLKLIAAIKSSFRFANVP